MTKDEALDLALEFVEANHFGGQDAFELITAIKQARSAPVQEAMPENWFAGMPEEYRKEAWRVATPPAAPVQPVSEGWKLVPINPTQEMLDAPTNAWPADALITWNAMISKVPAAQPAPVQQESAHNPLWLATHPDMLLTPTAQPAPVQEPVAQLGDGVLWCDTCRSVQETIHHTSPNDRDVWCKGEAAWLQGPFYTTPPAAQRQFVGLTDKQMVDAIEPLYQNRAAAEMAAKVSMDEFRAIEAKLRSKNNG